MDARRDAIIREIQAEWSPATEYARRAYKTPPVSYNQPHKFRPASNATSQMQQPGNNSADESPHR